MIDVKQSFDKGLDLDSSLLSMQPDSYLDALNVTRDAIAQSQDRVITNIIGNQLVEYTLPSGTNKCIGAYGFSLRNTVIYFIYNSDGSNSVLEFNTTTRTVTKIFISLVDSATDILNFTEDGKITGVNIYPRDEGDLLFFLDSLGRPTVMNITRFKNDEYNPVVRSIIDVAKRVPLSPPAAAYGNDGSQTVNYFRKLLTKYCYVWIFDDNEECTCSPESAVPLPANILDIDFTNVSTNNNVVTVSLNTGPKNVKAIRLLMAYSQGTNEWTDFATIEVINKADNFYDDDVNISFDFYNNGTYATYEVARRIQLFDWVPFTAKAQDMPNGNYVAYGALEEGLDRTLTPNVVITIDTVAAGGGIPIGSLNILVVLEVHNTFTNRDTWKLTFSGVPAVGTVISITLQRVSDGVMVLAGTYTTIAGDTAITSALGLRTSLDAMGVIFGTNYASGDSILRAINQYTDYNWMGVVITQPSSSGATNSIATWKFSSRRTAALQYYNQTGITNGVLYTQDISFSHYNENGSDEVLLPFLNVKIYHQPPEWAYSYQILMSLSDTYWLYWECINVLQDADYIYFDVTNIGINSEKNPTVAAVLSYTFLDGDRLRLIRRMSDGFVYGPSFDTEVVGQVVDPVISSVTQTGTFIKIPNAVPFTAEDYSTDFFVIEIYRPTQSQATSENQTFREFGIQYAIIDPTTDDRVHAGEVTNQSTNLLTPAEFNIYEGDAYFRGRTVYLSDTGQGTFPVQDPNFVDTYISAVSSISGRPSKIDLDAKETFFGAFGRYSQEYQANTNINKLNRFPFLNFFEVDYSYGDIERFIVRDRAMRVYQNFKVGFLPLFSQTTRTPDGTITVTTDNLINPIQYYLGNWGIGRAATSLVSYNNVDYYCSPPTGTICRLSQDGVTPISVIYKINSWATENIPLRNGASKIYGVFDQRLNNYIIAVEASGSSPAQTLSFDEETNSFESFLSYKPEMMVAIGTLIITFKDGQVWTHDSETYNNFYGVQYDSTFTPVFNNNALIKKGWQNITEIASGVWDCPLIFSNVMSYGSVRQETNLVESEFVLLEGNPSTTIKRDVNSRGGKWNGNFIKGNYLAITFRVQQASELEYLSTISVNTIMSPLTKTN